MAKTVSTHLFGSKALKLALSCPMLALLACASAKPSEPASSSAPASGTEPSTAADATGDCTPRDAPPTTAEECTCAGGVIHGDIGDGKVACAPDEVELGRIQQGIEGAVCCRPAAAVL